MSVKDKKPKGVKKGTAKAPKKKEPAQKLTKGSKPKPKEAAEPKGYKGFNYVTDKKRKAAVDRLAAVVANALNVSSVGINFMGKWDPIGKYWHVAAILLPPNLFAGGFIWQRSAEHAGILHLAERVLSTFGAKPKKMKVKADKAKGIKAHTEVKDWHKDESGLLQEAIRLPSASKMQEMVFFVQWMFASKPHLTIGQLMAARPDGFYGQGLEEILDGFTQGLHGGVVDALAARFTKGESSKPRHPFVLSFKGVPQTVTVSAEPYVFHRWMGENDVQKHLAESPRDLVAVNPPARTEEVQRFGYKDGVDLVIVLDDAGKMEFTHTLGKCGDPAKEWIRRSQEALLKEQTERDERYKSSKDYGRVSGELAMGGESVYRGVTIKPQGGDGYTLTGHDYFANLMEAMREVDAQKEDETSPHRITLGELLSGNDQVEFEALKWFFRRGEFPTPKDKGDVIRYHVATEYQRETLKEMKVTVEDIINGVYEDDDEGTVKKIILDWNERLGGRYFEV